MLAKGALATQAQRHPEAPGVPQSSCLGRSCYPHTLLPSQDTGHFQNPALSASGSAGFTLTPVQPVSPHQWGPVSLSIIVPRTQALGLDREFMSG